VTVVKSGLVEMAVVGLPFKIYTETLLYLNLKLNLSILINKGKQNNFLIFYPKSDQLVAYDISQFIPSWCLKK
jgi:hypothetical protein